MTQVPKGVRINAVAQAYEKGGMDWDGDLWVQLRAEAYWQLRHEYQLLILQAAPDEFRRIWPNANAAIGRGPGGPVAGVPKKLADALNKLREMHKEVLRTGSRTERESQKVAGGAFQQCDDCYLPEIDMSQLSDQSNKSISTDTEHMVTRWRRIKEHVDTCRHVADDENIHPDAISGKIKSAVKALVTKLLSNAADPKQGTQFSRSGILWGPPGTGKTVGAKWMARELDIPFLSVDPMQLGDKYFGEETKRFEALFQAMRLVAPALLFWDEGDAFFPDRADSNVSQEVREQVSHRLKYLAGDAVQVPGLIMMLASNHPSHLDQAVESRFSTFIMEVKRPSKADLQALYFSLFQSKEIQLLADVPDLKPDGPFMEEVLAIEHPDNMRGVVRRVEIIVQCVNEFFDEQAEKEYGVKLCAQLKPQQRETLFAKLATRPSASALYQSCPIWRSLPRIKKQQEEALQLQRERQQKLDMLRSTIRASDSKTSADTETSETFLAGDDDDDVDVDVDVDDDNEDEAETGSEAQKGLSTHQRQLTSKSNPKRKLPEAVDVSSAAASDSMQQSEKSKKQKTNAAPAALSASSAAATAPMPPVPQLPPSLPPLLRPLHTSVTPGSVSEPESRPVHVTGHPYSSASSASAQPKAPLRVLVRAAESVTVADSCLCNKSMPQMVYLKKKDGTLLSRPGISQTDQLTQQRHHAFVALTTQTDFSVQEAHTLVESWGETAIAQFLFASGKVELHRDRKLFTTYSNLRKAYLRYHTPTVNIKHADYDTDAEKQFWSVMRCCFCLQSRSNQVRVMGVTLKSQ